jgi:hypothetical protein
VENVYHLAPYVQRREELKVQLPQAEAQGQQEVESDDDSVFATTEVV